MVVEHWCKIHQEAAYSDSRNGEADGIVKKIKRRTSIGYSGGRLEDEDEFADEN